MKKMFALSCLACLAGTVCAAENAVVTIASWNIQIGKGMDGKLDLERTAAALAQLDAETIAFNEVDCRNARTGYVDMPKFLAAKTGMYVIFSAARADPPEGLYGNMVMSRYPLELVEAFLIPATPEETRGALLVKVVAPTPYYLLTTHLSYQQNPEVEAIRIEALDVIAGRLAKYADLPVILAGDLNAVAGSAPVEHLRELGFIFANDLAPASTFPASEPKMVLDYIAIAPGAAAAAVEFRVIEEKEASDHRPIEAEIRFE